MLGNDGLITISRYWKTWSDPRLIILVLNNGDLNQVTWEMRVMEGDPKYQASQDVPDFRVRAVRRDARTARASAWTTPTQVGPAWDEALSADRPVVLEAITDPDVPPLPPHITLEQAKKYASALLEGDPDEGGIIRQTVRDAFARVLPGSKHGTDAGSSPARARRDAAPLGRVAGCRARSGVAPAADGSATGPRVTLGEPVPVRSLTVHVYTVPTDEPESDGTLAWDSTTMVLVEAAAGDTVGLGYTYAARPRSAPSSAACWRRWSRAATHWTSPACWSAMVGRIRNLGRPGIASMAIAAVDNALWDLKARLLGVPLASLLGRVRRRVPVYGSGGFTSYSLERLAGQLAGWVAQGIRRVKMKVARRAGPGRRSGCASPAAPSGATPSCSSDANGALHAQAGARVAGALRRPRRDLVRGARLSDDLEGLRLLRDRGPGGMDIAAGEYGYER